MKFSPVRCPTCGQLAKGTLETLPGMALLGIDPDTGEADYEGRTEIWWNDQRSNRDLQGRYMLTCENGHEWPAEMQA
jgi:hypothetical protein